MAAAGGPPVPPGAAHLFSSPCPPRSRRTYNLPQLLPRRGQPLFSTWPIPHCQNTPVHAVRSRPCSSEERRFGGILFSHFVKTRGTRPCKTRCEKHPNLRLHCGNVYSAALPRSSGESRATRKYSTRLYNTLIGYHWLEKAYKPLVETFLFIRLAENHARQR